MPRVSVIIPTYNHCKYVLTTLQSVFGQLDEVLEVLVVNDGSPDGTAGLLAPLARTGKIRYLEQRNQGQAAARNRGLFQARGEFVAFIDDDDLWPPGKLRWQREFLDTHCDVGVVAGTAEFFDDNGPRHVFGRAQEITFENLFEGDPVASPGQTLIRASIARAMGGFNTTVGSADDWDLWFRMSRVSRIVMVDRVALRYRVHAENTSRDVRHMIQSSFRAIELNLALVDAKARPKTRTRAYRALYRHWGRSALARTRVELKSQRYREAIRAVAAMQCFIPAWISDPKLLVEAAVDALPRSAFRAMEKLEGTTHRRNWARDKNRQSWEPRPPGDSAQEADACQR